MFSYPVNILQTHGFETARKSLQWLGKNIRLHRANASCTCLQYFFNTFFITIRAILFPLIGRIDFICWTRHSNCLIVISVRPALRRVILKLMFLLHALFAASKIL
jgi:hypothetical protein